MVIDFEKLLDNVSLLESKSDTRMTSRDVD